MIHKGFLNGSPVAIKKIFDPRLTDELLAEIQNEIIMQSILRHPNIALLMGVAPKIPNIVIVFEYVDQGSLFNLLHMKKNQVDVTLNQRLKIALDTARVFQYMHTLGIVHRDIKSHNVLIDHDLNVKVCDFGLARFKVSCFKQIFLTFSSYLFRLTWVKDRCSTPAHQCTWPLNYSKSASMMNQWMCLRTECSFGSWSLATCPTMASTQLISVPRWRRATNSECRTMSTRDFPRSSASAEQSMLVKDQASNRSCKSSRDSLNDGLGSL